MAVSPADAARGVSVLRVPALVAGASGAVWLDAEGEIEELTLAAAARRATAQPPLVCHAPATAQRLGTARFAALDLLELFAFTRPATFCLPTPGGLADALGIEPPRDRVDAAWLLMRAADRLLGLLATTRESDAAAIAETMKRAGWLWGEPVLAALCATERAPELRPAGGLDVWNRLPAWHERAPPAPPGDEPVDEDAARQRLARLLGAGAEQRPQQSDYAAAVSAAFAPREVIGAPMVVLAEAGTGVGKTLGYIAPASLWAEANRGTVWLSTYTKNLQRQIDQELDRLYPDAKAKAANVVIRKGRDNYLCLLNMEEAAGRAAAAPDAVALGLMARWAAATREGDLTGGDFPAWLVELVGYRRTLGLAHRRGECIYSACPHYAKCYIERTVRRARHAELVIANHALVMTQASLGEAGQALPSRYVFDEGHHLFEAADSTFAAHLSGAEMAELRRWLRGGEGRRRGRVRGLERRVSDLVANQAEAASWLAEARRRASLLPGEGWLGRVAEEAPRGPGERFLAGAYRHVLARNKAPGSDYRLEATAQPAATDLVEAARQLGRALETIARPLRALRVHLAGRLEREAGTLDTSLRVRIEAACRSLTRRIDAMLSTWAAMLEGLAGPTSEERDTRFVDWFSIERIDGRAIDAGLHRHWIDPTVPFASHVLTPAHGAVITSATLRDRADGAERDWTTAEVRTGVQHLALPARRASLPSPFDYARQTRVLVVRDVRRDAPEQVAAAYRELFLAAAGGGLGLFTAIARLRAVYRRIAEPLDAAGIRLLAQHVDPLDTATLVDIFRAEVTTCLLGTDAVRDGIDVPGRSLRLIVFDRVPWPRPDILHRARREAFGGHLYDDMLVRLRLKQAYGRLVRKADDRGVFVLLDPRMPTRLADAFPAGVALQRMGLAEAVATTARFLSSHE